MTPREIMLVKNSWALVMPDAHKMAKLFYDKAFELEPPLQALFTGDMAEQGRKLTNMIHLVVNSLDRIDAVMPDVSELGERHAEYGVKNDDYVVLGKALLWTLEICLDDLFTPDVKVAWRNTYNEIASAMQNAAMIEA